MKPAWNAAVRSSTEDASRHTFVTSLRTHCNAYRLYHIKESDYPADQTPAAYPPEMAGLLRQEAWTTGTTLGGQWDWDYGQFGFTAGVSLYQPNRTAEQMTEVDAIFDDGDLASGAFRQRAEGYINIIAF